MCIDGYTINLEIPELEQCSRILHITSNNLNQIARRLNSGGGYYPDEIAESPPGYTKATVVDHIVPHRDDPILFWDSGNWQPLCKKHHDQKTAYEDSRPVYTF